MNYDWQSLFLTFKLALVTTVILVVCGIPLAYWLAFSRKRSRFIIEPLVSLPLVLPPTVLGFYILVAFSPKHFLGSFLESSFGIRVAFSFSGLVIGSVLFSLPFMVNPVKAGFQGFPVNLIEASYCLGKTRWQTLCKVVLPNMKPALLSGFIMAFAHTIGEFGVVLMVGGNIPNQTRVASISIFSEVEALNYDTAGFYSLILVGISFTILFLFYFLNRKSIKLF